jgi:Uma2 family endonuclease
MPRGNPHPMRAELITPRRRPGGMVARALLPPHRRAEQTMGMPEAGTVWTAEMVRALPEDGWRYEVVDGELLVTPSPSYDHQRAVGQVFRLLADYADRLGFCEAIVSPADVELDTHGLVQPDVYVQRLVDGRPAGNWNAGAPLLLVVEVLSASTARADRITKRRRYQRARIPEYWIVDCDARTIERWRPDDERPEILADEIAWHPEGARNPLVIDLARLFARIHGGGA